MAMSAGTVTIDANGDPNAGSSGTMARSIYDALVVTMDMGDFELPTGALQSARQRLADIANAVASGVVSHVTSNAEVTVTVSTSDSGLQLIPATPVSEDDPCKAPASSVELATKGTIT